MLEAGISFDWVTGKDLRESHWDAFFDFYMETGSRKWGSPYLTRKFFSLISKSMGRMSAHSGAARGRIIAGALNFIGSEALYGRNWGASEHHDFLHFETCYYQAIDFAIQHKLKRVEAGAQGQHKLARGYLPVKTYSLHHFAHPGLARAVGNIWSRNAGPLTRTRPCLRSTRRFGMKQMIDDGAANEAR